MKTDEVNKLSVRLHGEKLFDHHIRISYFPKWFYSSLLMDNPLKYDYFSINETLNNLYQFDLKYDKESSTLSLVCPIKNVYSGCLSELLQYVLSGLANPYTGLKTRNTVNDMATREFLPESEKDSEFIISSKSNDIVVYASLIMVKNKGACVNEYPVLEAKFKVNKIKVEE